MNFELSDEQRLLRESMNAWLKRASAAQGLPEALSLWSGLNAEVGVLGIGTCQTMGGTGGGAVEIMLIMEELGAALAVEPFVETVVIATSLLQKAGALASVAAIGRGELIATLAWLEPSSGPDPLHISTRAVRTAGGWRIDGNKSVVAWAQDAHLLLVTARTGDFKVPSLFLIPRNEKGVALAPYSTIDGRPAADVTLSGVSVPNDALLGTEGDALSSLECTLDEARAALCAEAVKVLRVLFDTTVAYSKDRRQFGHSIASFQAVQHRLADMFLQVELASAASLLATLSLSKSRPQRIQAVSAAKATIASACRFVGQNAIQLHGGMGISAETAITRYFKRATALEFELGSRDYHVARHRAASADEL